uniref:Uncharacterized protein n=1 Tax=Setaria italica TaxID=4555 RepID=K3ZBI2_SETIT
MSKCAISIEALVNEDHQNIISTDQIHQIYIFLFFVLKAISQNIVYLINDEYNPQLFVILMKKLARQSLLM